MKPYKIYFTFVLLAATAFTACSLDADGDNYCFSQATIATQGVTGQDSTTVNVPVTLNVSFRILNDCGAFNRFNETLEFPKDIAPLIDYTGCECEETTGIVSRPYTFNAATAGTYQLRFLTANENAPIVKTITVTNE